MPELPPYVFDPIFQHATQASNAASGKPKVEILCGGEGGKRMCAKPLGGVWNTMYGAVLQLNDLKPGVSVSRYKRLAERQEERERLWRESGDGYYMFPVYLRVDGQWRQVPGERQALVRCPRHRSWRLDTQAVFKELHEAEVTRTRRKHITRPPGVQQPRPA
jgi:hypothetical protein